MLQDLLPVFLTVGFSIIALVILFLGQQLDKLLKAKVDAVEYELIKGIVVDLVEAAEQWLGSDTGQQKRAYVLQQAATYAREKGIKLTSQQLSTCIESAVYNVKYLQNVTARLDGDSNIDAG